MRKSKVKPKMQITESAFFEATTYIGGQRAESGGLFFSRENEPVIRKFVPDIYAKTTRSTYSIHTLSMNPVIKREWTENGYELIGIGHSHPHGNTHPSEPDKQYFEQTIKRMPRENFFVPIFNTIPDGGYHVYPYVYKNGNPSLIEAQLEIVPDDFQTTTAKEVVPQEKRIVVAENQKTTSTKTDAKIISVTENITATVQDFVFPSLILLLLVYISGLFVYSSLWLTPIFLEFIAKTLKS